jgi:hypothetical protein
VDMGNKMLVTSIEINVTSLEIEKHITKVQWEFCNRQFNYYKIKDVKQFEYFKEKG